MTVIVITGPHNEGDLMEKKNVLGLYNLPREIEFCKECTISNQRPRITFNEHGVCSACDFARFKKEKIDWNVRNKELMILCDKHRSKDGSFDVIVPCSGGKDGSYVAHRLKNDFGMTPLAVTWAPLKASEIGRRNLDAFIESGFDHVLGTPNPKLTKQLTRLAFEHIGDPFQPFIYGQTNFPLHIATKYNIPLIFYGENGEVEYGGDMKNAMRPTREITDHNKHYFSGKPPEFWVEHGMELRDLEPFMAPAYDAIMKTGVEIHFFSYYDYWDPQENYYYCRENTGFIANNERSEGTYSKYASLDDKLDGFHYYLGFIKFGIGRTTSDTAHEIRDGKITRDEGIALVEKYDGEFPRKYYEDFLEFCDVTPQEVEDVIDSWRSDHIWEFTNTWKLKKGVWS